MDNWKIYQCVESKQHTAEQLSNNESGRTGNLKGSILRNEIETVIKCLPKSREELALVVLNSSNKLKREHSQIYVTSFLKKVKVKVTQLCLTLVTP